jgi:hypothetical protein
VKPSPDRPQQLTRLITGAAAQQKLLKYYITDFIVRVRRVGRTKKKPANKVTMANNKLETHTKEDNNCGPPHTSSLKFVGAATTAVPSSE